MSDRVLKTENLSKQISVEFSLKDINLELYMGEVHGLFGENGSGKTTLMHILSGLIPKDNGDIRIDGQIVHIQSPVDARKYGISMIPQEPHLFEHFSVAENIYAEVKPYSNNRFKIIDQKTMYKNCEQLFERIGFSLDCRTLAKNLGFAHKQMVGIAKAFVSNARVILMDEPTTILNETEVNTLFNVIQKLKQNGTAILVISHRLEELTQISDRISIMRSGRIICTELNQNLEKQRIIHTAIGTEFRERYPKLNVKLGKEVLRVSHLHSSPYLTDINFSLRSGEVLGILGLAGSGRSSIARTIFGLNHIESGDIFIDQKKVSICSPIDAIKAGIGYITEDRSAEGLFPRLKIYENITVNTLNHFNYIFPFVKLMNRSKEKQVSKKYLRSLSLNHVGSQEKLSVLSEGNQQKILLTKWMLKKSKVLILDEPTKGIDLASKIDIYNLMNQIIRIQTGIILISSDVDELLGMCDRIMVLYDKQICGVLTREEASKEKLINLASGGK